MGLMKKYAERYAQKHYGTIDHAALLQAGLGEDDRLMAWATAVPSAYKRKAGVGSVEGRLMQGATNIVTNAVSQARHLGGEPGSIARSLPLDSTSLLSISTKGITLWDTADFTQWRRAIDIPRERIASLVDTGDKAQGGASIGRLSFTDGSFIDYRLSTATETEFWVAAGGLGAA